MDGGAGGDGGPWRPEAATLRRLLLAAAILVAAQVVIVTFASPDPAGFTYPTLQRIFYYHVPAAWVGFLAFFVTFVASLRYIQKEDLAYDAWAAASAEVGSLFTIIGLVTGILWTVEFGGDYSLVTDPKLITTSVLALTFLAYLALRRNVEETTRRASLAAVFGILGFVAVPLSYLASLASVHPAFAAEGSELAPSLGRILGFSMVAFTVLFAYLLLLRREILLSEEEVAAWKRDRERL